MPWSTVPAIGSFRKKGGGNEIVFPMETPGHYRPLSKACGRWGHVFATTVAPALGPQQKKN